MSTEDQKAIVVENGSHFIKAGFGGEDSPLAVFPSVVGTVQNLLDSKEFYVGDEAQINHSNLKLNYPIDQGFILNWDDMEKVSVVFAAVLYMPLFHRFGITLSSRNFVWIQQIIRCC